MHCYIALLFTENFDRYRIELPDFPGCAAWARTLGEAPGIAARLLGEEIALRRATRLAIPRPSAGDVVATRAALLRALPLVVPSPASLEERVSVSVELPAGLVERVDRRARSHGVDRSDLLAKAARLALWETGRADRNGKARWT